MNPLYNSFPFPNSETTSTSAESSSFPRTLLIFDFDDTIFCTKYFDTFSLPYPNIFNSKISLEKINASLVKELQDLQSSIIALFSKMILNFSYDVVIVSNAGTEWINNCLTFFIPQVKMFINENDIKIYSAKTLYCNSTKDSVEWKVKTFKKILQNMNINNKKINVVSIGDGDDEKKAVFRLQKSFYKESEGDTACKFIKMISFPSAASIIMQLKYLKDNINSIIQDKNKIFKMIIEIKNNEVQINCVSQIKKRKKSVDRVIFNINESDFNIEENEENKENNEIKEIKEKNDLLFNYKEFLGTNDINKKKFLQRKTQLINENEIKKENKKNKNE